MMASSITFIGYRGSGKSAVGSLVAERLGWAFVDADVELEHRAGTSIREIFALQGEAAFRALEESVLADLLARKKTVIAAGGGAVLSAATRALLKNSGPVVFLNVSPHVAEQRIAADATTVDRRPALTTLPARAEIETMIESRLPLYEACATVTLDADSAGPVELAEQALRAIAEQHRRETAP